MKRRREKASVRKNIYDRSLARTHLADMHTHTRTQTHTLKERVAVASLPSNSDVRWSRPLPNLAPGPEVLPGVVCLHVEHVVRRIGQLFCSPSHKKKQTYCIVFLSLFMEN